uniref:Uncharacterized protein AlNc14C73G4975 n=1 Tax=Albugo laibachii Nc14 TaxID=890382 RepID=F0WEB8_9STRA|nr:conserved hypothetical protein [Albugo laibachii Nc14]|eukprot:CCA19549.1 conserved hypothetical protein [Albugo laibachii Nc14]
MSALPLGKMGLLNQTETEVSDESHDFESSLDDATGRHSEYIGDKFDHEQFEVETPFHRIIDAQPQSTLHGQTNPLPSHFLGKGYVVNSYFVCRLRYLMYCMAFIDCVGIAAFWFTDSIDDGGIYVEDASASMSFRRASCVAHGNCSNSCETIVVYGSLIYHMLPLVILIGLPASGWRIFEPFERVEPSANTFSQFSQNEESRRLIENHESNEAGSSDQPTRVLTSVNSIAESSIQMHSKIAGKKQNTTKLRRTAFLQICELIAVLVLWINFLIMLYYVYALFHGDALECDYAQVQLYVDLAVIPFVLHFVELCYFFRYREHIKMQLGAFHEEDQTGGLKSAFAKTFHPRRLCQSESSSFVRNTRKALYKAAELENFRHLSSTLVTAQERLGRKFASRMYSNPKLRLFLFSKSKKNPLHAAAANGNVQMIDVLIHAGIGVNSLDKVARMRLSTGDVFLYFAKFFISDPVPSDTATSIYRTTLVTPLHCAVYMNQIEAVKALIAHGADVNKCAKSSNSNHVVPPLFIAENTMIVRLLLEAGANHLLVPDPGHQNTLTALQLAYLSDNILLAQELEKWGGDVALTPLHAAAGANHDVMVRKLLKRKADPNSLGEFGYEGLHRRTPLHWAAVNNASSSLLELLTGGGNPNFQDRLGRTPLHWAASLGSTECVLLLLQNGADCRIRDVFSMTPMLCGGRARLGNNALINHLIKYGADINDCTLTGDTALHLAVKEERLETALSLIACGADMHKVNQHGFRPLDNTTSTKFQFEMKRASGYRDVLLKATPTHAAFALKLKDSLERMNITAWQMDHDESKILDDTLWREKLVRDIASTSIVIAVITQDFTLSEPCLRELATAKEVGTPVMAVSIEHARIGDDLQVYLYTRQVVPFESAIVASHPDTPTAQDRLLGEDHTDLKSVSYLYDETRYEAQFRLLLDGVRDEIEKQRKGQIQKQLSHNQTAMFESTLRGHTMFDSLVGSHTSFISNREVIVGSELDYPNSESTSQISGDSYRSDPAEKKYIFIAHGDCHRAFVRNLHERLSSCGYAVIVDGGTLKDLPEASNMKERIQVSKNAILGCATCIVIVSERTAKNELVSDQLAFAEDKQRPIFPVLLNDVKLNSSVLSLLSYRPLYHFTTNVGFTASLHQLMTRMREILPQEGM